MAIRVLYGQGSERELYELDLVRQSATAKCMRDAGFEYEPEARSVAGSDVVKTYRRNGDSMLTVGYAIATTAVATEIATAMQNYLQTNGQNARYVSSLSPDSLAKYNFALYGPSVQGGANGDSSTYAAADPTAGCVGEGQQAADESLGLKSAPSTQSQLLSELASIDSTVHSDTRYETARAAWSGCMKSNGYTFQTPADASNLVGSWVANVGTATTKDVQATTPDGAEVTLTIPDFGEQLVDIASRELQLAAMDWTCDDSAKLTATENSLRLAALAPIADKYFLGN